MISAEHRAAVGDFLSRLAKAETRGLDPDEVVRYVLELGALAKPIADAMGESFTGPALKTIRALWPCGHDPEQSSCFSLRQVACEMAGGIFSGYHGLSGLQRQVPRAMGEHLYRRYPFLHRRKLLGDLLARHAVAKATYWLGWVGHNDESRGCLEREIHAFALQVFGDAAEWERADKLHGVLLAMFAHSAENPERSHAECDAVDELAAVTSWTHGDLPDAALQYVQSVAGGLLADLRDAAEGLLLPSKTQGYRTPAQEVPIDAADKRILEVLATEAIAMSQVEIEDACSLTGGLRLARRTIGIRLERLRGEGLTYRPFGEKGGDAITDRGSERLARTRCQ